MWEEKSEDGLQDMFVKLTHLYFRKIFVTAKETGIHPKQIPLLGLVGQKEGVSQREISQILKISAPTVAVSVKRLEKAGMVKRENDQKDQRVVRVYLTEKGKEITQSARDCIEESEKAIFAGFTDSELCLLKRFFKQMIENLSKDTPSGI